MQLPKVKTTKKTEFRRQNTLLYGLPKVGKSTFASQIPGALFLATEEGHNHLEVFKVNITKWEDVLALGNELQKPGHGFTTLVIDIVDWLYKHCEHYICTKFEVFHPSDLAYGKGFSLVKDEFVRVLNRLNQIGFGMIFISHAKEREMKKKNMSFTYMDTTLSGSSSQLICGLCDYILYAYIDEKGQRVMRTKPTTYINAGDRSGKLPEILPFNYLDFSNEFAKTVTEIKPSTQGDKK
jgi:hypothetical protein